MLGLRCPLISRNPEDQALGKVACWVDDDYGNAVELTGTAEVGEPTPT